MHLMRQPHDLKSRIAISQAGTVSPKKGSDKIFYRFLIIDHNNKAVFCAFRENCAILIDL